MTEKRVEQMINIHKESLELFKKKNIDYGDAFASYGPIGVIIRIGDKIQRLLSISKKEIILVDNESLRDTLIDLHNYAAMAIMLIDEECVSKKCDNMNNYNNINYNNINYNNINNIVTKVIDKYEITGFE